MQTSRKATLAHRFRNWRYGGQPEALSVWEALGEEYWGGQQPDAAYTAALDDYRSKRQSWQEAGKPDEGALRTACEQAESAFRKVLVRLQHGGKRTALCFSGGGIRSAVFGLGVLESLAAHSSARLLGEVDYLSTVSGGGYLGGWFSSWASRHAGGPGGAIGELGSAPEAQWEPEANPLRYLRRFSNYLNPQLGAFSADTWTLAATVARNIVLNWLVLLPLLAAVLVLPRILLALVSSYPAMDNDYIVYASAAALVVAVAYMVTDLPSAGDARRPQSRFLVFGLVPLLLAAVGFSLYWAWQGDLHSEPPPASLVLYGVGIMALGVLAGLPFACRRRRKFLWAWLGKGVAFSLVTGAVGGLLSYWMTWSFTDPVTGDLYDDRLYAWLAVPSLLGVFALAQAVLVAMTSTIAKDEDREWWSRSMAWIFISMVCCFGFSGIVLMMPLAAHHLPPIHWQGLATAAAGLLASRIGFSPRTAATKERQAASAAGSAFERAPQLILPVFLLLLVALIATFDEMASSQLKEWIQKPPAWSPFAPTSPSQLTVELLLVAFLALPALVLSRFIDANKFSLHSMYRARLIRTFLGASNPQRNPNPFTGFDPNDNIPMADLPTRPLHVVNATLNLVKGQNLAWQQRKAESFTFTRYHAGSCRVGYQRSAEYAGGATLGGAMTISGAAANPNMGYVSSPLLGMVMTLFNARLGVWLANPGEAGRGCWLKTGPTYSFRPFIDEALGLTNDTNAWVNLSDGGHFENLGLYEMVLRRVATIVIVDGSADPGFRFDDLGNAVRKIRIDMGIPIEFPKGIPITKEITPGSRHAAVGRIGYRALDGDGAEDGVLVYIKASRNGNEPRDVTNYAEQNPDFPHQSTADQWFDESQFESYRRLGYHVVEEIFDFGAGACTMAEFAERVRSYSAGQAKSAATPA